MQEPCAPLTGSPTYTDESQLDTFAGYNVDGTPQFVRHYGPDAGKTFDSSDQLAIAPIWDICGYPGFLPSCSFPGGTTPTLEVVGFAVIFLAAPTHGHGQDNVDAILIKVTGCDLSAAPDPQIAPQTIPIRLVRTE